MNWLFNCLWHKSVAWSFIECVHYVFGGLIKLFIHRCFPLLNVFDYVFAVLQKTVANVSWHVDETSENTA